MVVSLKTDLRFPIPGQQGHGGRIIHLYNQSFTDETLTNLGYLPHPAIQKFTVITLAVVGASRRFLSQITRHQNEVKFMSASLQYSNYSGEADFAIPYEIISSPPEIQAVFCKPFLHKIAKSFCRLLHLHFVGNCKVSAGSYPASRMAIADSI